MQAEPPFEDYRLYIVTHKGENNRKMANLVSASHRTTLSYARYLMCVKLGRKLLPKEQVDHIDNNPLNDSIENLQVLSPQANAQKHSKLHPGKTYKFICPVCGVEFVRPRNRVTTWLKTGRVPSCSKTCMYIRLYKNDPVVQR
jgi:hypothetical protein